MENIKIMARKRLIKHWNSYETDSSLLLSLYYDDFLYIGQARALECDCFFGR